jgi:peroxiredoxin
MIQRGSTAPDFTVPGTDGDGIDKYTLSDYTETGAAVLIVYPFDFSPVCTEELCSFRDAGWLLFTEGVDVFGVSPDSCYAHKRFIRENDLPFPLLSDTLGRVTDKYGLAYDEWEHHKGVPKRALVTVDDSRTVRYTWMTEDATVSPTLRELHQTVTALTDS